MSRLEREEKKTLHVATEDYYMAMTTCEDGVDTSYMTSGKAKMLCEAIGCTDVGQAIDRLDRQLNQCMLAELVESPGLEVPGGIILQGMTTLGRMRMNPSLTMAARCANYRTLSAIIGSTIRLPRPGQG